MGRLKHKSDLIEFLKSVLYVYYSLAVPNRSLRDAVRFSRDNMAHVLQNSYIRGKYDTFAV
jgi:hypothetical protein